MNIERSLLLILERLDLLDRRMDCVESYIKQAENAADAAKDAAQTSLLAFESVSGKLEILQREHAKNHRYSDSLVPTTLDVSGQK